MSYIKKNQLTFITMVTVLTFSFSNAQKSVGIGTDSPDPSAALDISAEYMGVLIPRLSEEQRDDITDPAEGLLISCTDCSSPGLHQYINGSWQAMMQSNQTGDYGTVVNPATGKVWLDRNLGASQVATASDDEDSYGDLYQWGRNADGHQRRDLNIPAQTTDQQASNFFTTHGNFIIGNSNWLDPAETHMWSGTAAENNPCPSGFRIPTASEWEQERRTWSSNNAAGAFASLLRLPLAGFRSNSNGSLFDVGNIGAYWSSTVGSTNSRYLFFSSSNAAMGTSSRASGLSVRCLKD